MGLLDVLNGMQQGPRGPSTTESQSEGGMSPMTMAILGLLAWKAIKHLTGDQSGTAPQPTPQPAPSSSGGDLGSTLKGALGGLLAGGAAGSVISGGVGELLKQLEQSGHGDTAKSWVSPGPNKSISPNDLANALGADKIDQLSAQSGLSRDELTKGLSQYLPKVVDQLTPEGRLPTDADVSRRL